MIKLKNISFQYPCGKQVLNNFDLHLQARDRLGLVGPNGAGKTTVFKIIMGLLTPQQGEISIFNQLCKEESDFREVREKVGYLFQNADDQLFCPTVEEEIAFGPLNLGKNKQEVADIVAEMLELVGLTGYEQEVTYQLSGGEKKRIALAAVLAMKPDILLLDEPFVALDSNAVEQTISILTDLNLPYIIVSHNEKLLDRLTNRICYVG
ncbi:ABC transporter ATP-binding protein [Halanaerocella petrolearia]